MPIPVPCHQVPQWWHGLVMARGARTPEVLCVPPSRAALGTQGLLPPPVPETRLCPHRVPQPRALPPPCAMTCAVTTAMCHGCLVSPALPGDSPSTIRPCPAPAQAALCLADTKGLRGEGGAGRGLPASDTRVSGSSARPPAPPLGCCWPRPLSWVPRECWGAPRGAALTDTEGADVAELGKEPLVPERPAGTPTHGPAQETPRVPAEEQGGIPIPSAGLLQVTERRRECGPQLGSLPVPGVPACPWGPLLCPWDVCLPTASPACPQHLGSALGFPACPRESSASPWGLLPVPSLLSSSGVSFPSLGSPDTPRVPW